MFKNPTDVSLFFVLQYSAERSYYDNDSVSSDTDTSSTGDVLTPSSQKQISPGQLRERQNSTTSPKRRISFTAQLLDKPEQRTVSLWRPSNLTSWGFGFGTTDEYGQHIVTSVRPDTPADGNLFVGDVILAVGDDSLEVMSTSNR